MTAPTVYMTRSEYEREFGPLRDGDDPKFVTSIHPGPDGYGLAPLVVVGD